MCCRYHPLLINKGGATNMSSIITKGHLPGPWIRACFLAAHNTGPKGLLSARCWMKNVYYVSSHISFTFCMNKGRKRRRRTVVFVYGTLVNRLRISMSFSCKNCSRIHQLIAENNIVLNNVRQWLILWSFRLIFLDIKPRESLKIDHEVPVSLNI